MWKNEKRQKKTKNTKEALWNVAQTIRQHLFETFEAVLCEIIRSIVCIVKQNIFVCIEWLFLYFALIIQGHLSAKRLTPVPQHRFFI